MMTKTMGFVQRRFVLSPFLPGTLELGIADLA